MGKYIVGCEIGHGSFSSVHICYEIDDPSQVVACKNVDRQHLTKRIVNNLRNEITALKKINSPHVVKLVDVAKTKNNFYLFLEHCNGGDLESILKKRRRMKEHEARYIMH